jgi:ribonuclease HI
MAKKRFYVVWDGVNPGVYADWKSCEAQIKGYAAAKYTACDTEAEAQEWFANYVGFANDDAPDWVE